jgi:hypothetical protein
MCKELASLPRGLKVTAGLTCYGISCVSAVVASAKGYDSLFALDDCKEVVTCAKFAAVSIVSAYLGHQIYKHAYTYEAQLAQQKAKDQQK